MCMLTVMIAEDDDDDDDDNNNTKVDSRTAMPTLSSAALISRLSTSVTTLMLLQPLFSEELHTFFFYFQGNLPTH